MRSLFFFVLGTQNIVAEQPNGNNEPSGERRSFIRQNHLIPSTIGCNLI